MKSIGRFLTNPTVISVIGLLIIAALVWFMGPYIKFGDSNVAPLGAAVNRLLVILVIVGIWGLNNLRVQHKNNKCNSALADDLKQSQQAAPEDLTSGQAAEEMHQINQRFAEALGTLNKLRFESRGKKRALYELPWYIIIGPPGSGKTTALVNSGLEFPLRDQFGKGALQGVGGTRNCDWWFTNDAVLIDTAGRYTTQDSHRVIDSSAWEGFLSLLKRHRKRRPINGAIVAISLHDLLLQTEDERELHARTIRARLDELMTKLEIRFPVYLMFTKADLVSGFGEFFEDLGKEERDQVWGISLPDAPQSAQAPNFDFLSDELKKLTGRLYDRVLWRMHQERDVRRCAAIHGFPQQMENLSGIMETFVRHTFSQNRFDRQPYLRGVYLSSGTQDGTPIDRMMTSVAANFGFDGGGSQLAARQGKSFFITRLLQDVVFPESELVGANARYERFIRWSQRAAYGGLATAAVAALVVWSGSLARHKGYMNDVNAYVSEFSTESERVGQWNSDISATLPALNALAQASDVYDQESHPWLAGMGLYDSRIDANADKAYQAHLRSLFQPRLLNVMESVLAQGDPEGDLYNSFRIYMMFNRTEHFDKAMVADWFHAHWDRNLRGDAASREQLKTHLAEFLNLEMQPVELNQRVVQQTRQSLLRLPVAQRVYSRLTSRAENARAVDMMSYFGEATRNLYRIDASAAAAMSVPAMFTLQGYRALDLSPNSPMVADVLNERWILADENDSRVDYVKEDLKDISARLKDLYMADYIRTWSGIYRALDVAQFSNLRQAGDVLTAFSDPIYSPLRTILEVGLENTQLTPPVAEELADQTEGKAGRLGKVAKVASFAADKVEGTAVDKRFRELHLLARESKRGPAPVENILSRVKQLEEYMRDISMSPDPGKTAFTIAKARYQTGEGNPITALRSFATTLPDEPVGRWLNSLADESWRVLLSSAHQHINSEWHSQVYSPYGRALAGRYPLNSQSDNEIALYDFSNFFKPNGTIDSFYREYVEPFIDTRGNWTNKVVDRYTAGFSNSSLGQIKRALRIQNAFFKNSADTPSVQLELRPHTMDKSDARFTLDLGSQRVSYSHGPKFWTTVDWSGGSSERIRLLFEEVNGASRDRMYSGNWSWFRMLDEAQLQTTGQSNVYLISFGTDRGEGRKVVYEGRVRSVETPFDASVFSGFQCPETI